MNRILTTAQLLQLGIDQQWSLVISLENTFQVTFQTTFSLTNFTISGLLKQIVNLIFWRSKFFKFVNRSYVFSFHRPGLVNYSVPLELTKYLRSETEYLPWHRAISAVTYLANMLEDDTNLYPLFQVMKQNKSQSGLGLLNLIAQNL